MKALWLGAGDKAQLLRTDNWSWNTVIEHAVGHMVLDMARYVDNCAVLLLRFFASSLLGNFALF